MEWLDKDPFAKYQQKFEKVERGFLTKEELALIEKRNFKIVRLAWVRDLFVFSCYTGLSYIDVMQLTPANVTVGIDGGHWLMTSRQKTSNVVRVPLLPRAQQIIEKYKSDPRAMVADLCGITKNLTFHLARHTFALLLRLLTECQLNR